MSHATASTEHSPSTIAGLWRGEWVDDLRSRVNELPETLERDLSLRLDTEVLLAAADKLSAEILRGEAAQLGEPLRKRGLSETEIEQILLTLGAFLKRDCLSAKLRYELGSDDPLAVRRREYKAEVFEGWAPLGVLVHVAAGNAPTVAPLSVLEGLLAGNINLLKISSRDSDFGAHVLKALVDASEERALAPFVYALQFSSSEKDLLQTLFEQADGIAAWGGESAVASVRSMAPAGARIIAWGHKISMSYFSREAASDEECLRGLAEDTCRIEQQACSSPQIVYLDTEDRGELEAFARRLADVLPDVSARFGKPEPSDAEAAEITTVTELVKLDCALDRSACIEAEDRAWRLLVDLDPAPRPSPLFRTLWVKPLPRTQVVSCLRPLRSYLQTASLAAKGVDAVELSRALFAAGVTRIVEPGKALGFYPGEPHDGVYALQRYARRVGLELKASLPRGCCDFAQFEPPPPSRVAPDTPIMTKEDFLNHTVAPDAAELFFKSGGSSGAPKMSIFTYGDYHREMRATADGLFAAGLDPNTDRCMNLFYAGHLYGGFLSFYSILEHLKVPQFPMGMFAETQEVADAIVRHQVNTLCGMPSHMLKLFQENEDALKGYGGVTKLFYSGEMLSGAQEEWLRETFGIKLIKSAVYGSNDAGPIAHTVLEYPEATQCLMTGIQHMEIVKPETDEPTDPGETGRVLLTSRHRQGQRIERYEIGDLARWVEEPVETGRSGPFFELMGRYGDIFKCGGPFLNYRDFTRALADYGYSGRVQLVLTKEDGKEHIAVLTEADAALNLEAARAHVVNTSPTIAFVVDELKTVTLAICPAQADDFEIIGSSGKLRSIVDKRR